MGLVIDNHCHVSCEVPGRRYMPWQQSWLVSMEWAYGGRNPNKGRPPFLRDPQTLFPRQGLRYADPEGKYTIAAMDKGGIDMGVVLPIDYDFSWGSHSDIQIEEKHQHQHQMVQKYPGRFVSFGGPDPRRPGAKEIFRRAVTQYGAKGLKLIPKNGYYPWQAECYELYNVCMEFGLPASTCTEPNSGGYNRGRFTDPMHVLDVIGDFPDMPLTLLHAGNPLYDFFEKAVFVASGNPNTYIELNYWLKAAAGQEEAQGSPIFGMPIGASHVLNEETAVLLLASARDILGAHKITWGIDRHFGPSIRNTGWKQASWLKGLVKTAAKYGKQFTQEEVDLILGENVARVLKLKEYPEWTMERKYGYTRRDPRPRYH
ncbi:MAG: amidohydrolase family protein [Chloroflexi bacterium]|nr:amidohydrolase family protein [Chloroflexota bacterium]